MVFIKLHNSPTVMHLLLSLLLFQLCVADPGLPQAQVVLDAATFDDADSITAA